jgi:hypothetical protein
VTKKLSHCLWYVFRARRFKQLFHCQFGTVERYNCKISNADDYVWAQEEPKNMRTYSFMLVNFDFIHWGVKLRSSVCGRQQEVIHVRSAAMLMLFEWYLIKICLDNANITDWWFDFSFILWHFPNSCILRKAERPQSLIWKM